MKRSKFSLSHSKLFSGDMGELIPCGLIEVLPGDTIQKSTSSLVRVSPLLAPVMHQANIYIHDFFVPHRLSWVDWEDFITGGPNGENASVFPTIDITAENGAVGSLSDYLGVPPPTGMESLAVSALPFRAYNRIVNDWFRDQDLVAERAISTASGDDNTTDLTLFNRAWEKDYFTSSRPWPQKGPDVTIPLTGNAPIAHDAPNDSQIIGIRSTLYSGQPTSAINTSGPNAFANASVTSNYPMYADLSDVTAATVNDLRLALALQRYEENRARYGSRYVEYLMSAFGMRSSDARLQLAEYLGGGKSPIQFSEVLQTAPQEEGGDVGVGQLKGHGIGATRSNRWRRTFEEHGYVISLFSVLPKTMYVQGLPRTWNRRIKEDFFQPELQHIGQQEVYNKEIKANHAQPNGVFGYQDRYDEYRRMESGIGGEFRESELDFWHMARIFETDPALNSSFVTSVPTKRIFAVQSEDVLWVKTYHSIQARRVVAKTGRSFTF